MLEATKSFFNGVWGFLVDLLLLLPRLFHDLAVRPDNEDGQTRHLLTWEFGQAYRHLPSLLWSLAFKTRTVDEQLRHAMLQGNLRRTFGKFKLVNLGIGLLIGEGIWWGNAVIMGKFAGSSVFLAYVIDGALVCLAGVMFAELTVEHPVAGGPMTWTIATLGELPAALSMGLLFVVYTLASAAYGGILEVTLMFLFNARRDSLDGGVEWLGFVILVVVTLGLCLPNRSSVFVLVVANFFAVFFAVFTGIAGFTKADGGIFVSDFAPFGADGLFVALPYVMFSFTGFETISYAVEECKNPESDVMPAYMWSIGITVCVYVLMALSLGFMVTVDELNMCGNILGYRVPFSSCRIENLSENYYTGIVYAFIKYGMYWMKYIFVVGSMIAILTSLLVAMYATSRLVMVAGREWLLPPFLASINTRTKTPVYATLLCGSVAALLCLFFDPNDLANLAGVAYMLLLLMVSNVYLSRRYWPSVKFRYSKYGAVEAMAPRRMNESSMSSIGLGSMVCSSGINDQSMTETSNSMHSPAKKPSGTTRADTGTLPATAPEEAHIRETPAVTSNPRMWRLLNIEHRLTKKAHRWMVAVFVIFINAFGIGCGLAQRFSQAPTSSVDSPNIVWPFLVAWAFVTFLMSLMCPIEYEPATWKIHRVALPWVPSTLIFGLTFMVCMLARSRQYIASACIIGGVLFFYVFFSLPLSYVKVHSDAKARSGEREIELVFEQDRGIWTRVDQLR